MTYTFRCWMPKSKDWKEKIPSARGALQRAGNARPPGKLGTKTGLRLTGWQQAGPQSEREAGQTGAPTVCKAPNQIQSVYRFRTSALGKFRLN